MSAKALDLPPDCDAQFSASSLRLEADAGTAVATSIGEVRTENCATGEIEGGLSLWSCTDGSTPVQEGRIALFSATWRFDAQ